jgi:hypothetical protein
MKLRKAEAVPARKKYPDELWERVIRFALNLADEPDESSVNGASERARKQLGLVPEAPLNRAQQARVDVGDEPGVTVDEAARRLQW